MNFKDRVAVYLQEARIKIKPYRLPATVKMNDVIPGYAKIKSRRLWKDLTFNEFYGFMSMWIIDYFKRYGSPKRYAKRDEIASEMRKQYTTNEYKKAFLVLNKYIDGEIRDSDLDKNPGNVAYDIVKRFFVASKDLRNGWTSKTHTEAFRNELSL